MPPPPPPALANLLAAQFFAQIFLASSCIRVYSYNMAKVKLGSKEFDVDSEKIDARDCGVSVADCAEFARRMKTGEISRVKTLNLVSCFVLFCWNYTNMCFVVVFYALNLGLLFHRRA